MPFRLVLSRMLLGLMSLGFLCVSYEAMQAQQLQYSSAHRNGERQLPLTLNGGSAELREQLSTGRSAISLAVADFDGDGTPDLVTGFATSTGGALTLQRGSSAATSPTQADLAAMQRGELVPAFAETANITSLPVRPDILKAIDLKGDGAIDIVVAAFGDSSLFVLRGDGRGGFLPAQPIAAGGTIMALSTLRSADGSSLLTAGVCQSPDDCSVQIFAADGSLHSSLALPASASVVEAVSLNGHSASPDIAVIAGGHVLLADGQALIAGTASFETLPVSNAVAFASGYYLFDRRPYMQLAVLDSSATLHVLVRPGLDSHAVTQAESLAHRKLKPEQIATPPNPASLGWAEAETLNNVGSGGFSVAPIMLHARVSGSGGDDLLVLSGTQYITVRHAMDNTGSEMKTTPSITVDSAASSIAAAVPLRMSPDARQGIVVADGGVQPNVTLPPINLTFTVNTTTDASDTTVAGRCTSVGPQCTLRDAILLANADSATNRSGNKIDTVNVPAGTYNLTYSNGLDSGGNATHHIEITGPINIVGLGGATTTIVDGQTADKIFSINSGVVVSQNPFDTFITGLTLQNAKENNSAGSDPYGGIMDWDADGGGYLTIATSTLKNSTAFVGPGGAIAAFNAAGSGAGTLELDSSTVSGNGTPEEGGGLYVTAQVPLVLSATTISGNQAVKSINAASPGALGQGGGIFTFDNTLATTTQITNGSAITSNTSTDSGGGIYTNSGMTITSSSITGNTSGTYGGGLYISVGSSEVVTGNYLNFTTNTATTSGGAIYVTATGGTPLVMHYSRIHGNTNSTASGVGVGTGTANVTDNWWGCNGAGTGTGCDKVAGSATVTPYTTLTIGLTTTTPAEPNSFTATGSLGQDSASTVYTTQQDSAYSGVAATLAIVQNGGGTTNSSATTLSTSAAISTTATANAVGAGTATVTVDGTSVSAGFTVTAPDMTVTSSHSGTFVAGSTGNTYTLTATNSGNQATTAGVTVVDTLPSGFTATAMSGTNWVCTLATLTCTNATTGVAASGSYPPIALTVTASTTAGSYNNSVSVSGGGEFNTGNDTGTDSTTVVAGAITKFSVTGLGPFTAPGAAGSATVTALDANNNVATSFTGTVAITSNDADATLPANYTYLAGDNGVHVFPVTLNTAGTFSVTATATVGGYTGSETGIAVQAAVWLLNSNLQMEHINSGGTAINQTSVTGTASTLGALAFDNTGNVWAVGNTNNNVYEFSHVGTTISSGTTGGGVNTPTAIAIDGLGNAWIANGNNTITEFTNGRTAVTPSTGYQNGTSKLSTPTGLIIDNAGSIWITNSGNNTVTKIIGGAAPVVTPTITGTTNNTLGARP